ncbi:hypothetical protein OG936_06925 [Streptomyces sp. NBC_00846]|uniref:hypothetical protein n=1 Tax=Streptomyces sp. NBC_00846 TaxID=2975849 RepID=UPI0038639CA5|nr:hypothetical protein OG936_06925 [Streptomyces sp. NBC_00846]
MWTRVTLSVGPLPEPFVVPFTVLIWKKRSPPLRPVRSPWDWPPLKQAVKAFASHSSFGVV